MASPTLATTTWTGNPQPIQYIRFGGLPQPGTGVVMPMVDLNDGVNWFVENWQVSGDYIQLTNQQLIWQGVGTWTGTDYSNRKIEVPFKYSAANTPLPQALAQLSQAGEQYLSTDAVTGIRCKFQGHTNLKLSNLAPPYIYEGSLLFMSTGPWAEDLSGLQTWATPTIQGSSTGVRTDIYFDYPGTVFSRPRLTFSTSGGAPGITHFDWSSVDLGVDITIGAYIPPGGPHTMVLDAITSRIYVDGVEVAPVGSFPLLHPGTNHMQTFMQTDGAAIGSTSAFLNWTSYYEFA